MNLLYSHVDDVPEFSMPDGTGGATSFRLGVLDRYKAEVTLRQPLFLGGMGYNAAILADLGRNMFFGDGPVP